MIIGLKIYKCLRRPTSFRKLQELSSSPLHSIFLFFPYLSLFSSSLALPLCPFPHSLFLQRAYLLPRIMSPSFQPLNTFRLPNSTERKSVMYRVGFAFPSISDICVLCWFSNDVKYLRPFFRGTGFGFCHF